MDTILKLDQENASNVVNAKPGGENAGIQRRALGSLNQNQTQQRAPKLKPKNGDNHIRNIENRTRTIATREKHLPPVAQFQAFSVYEDGPQEKAEAPPPKDPPISPSLSVSDLPRLPFREKVDDACLESPMSVGSDACIAVKSATPTPLEEKKATAKTVRELFFHVAEYREDIYKYMREIEAKHRPKPGYMRKQPDISQSMRAILVDWLVEVSEEYQLQTETLYLAVSYIDRFLSYMSVVRAKLQLVGTAAMFIATKYEEIYPPDISEFVYVTDDTYTKQQVLRMEHLILKILSFDLSAPTPLAFVSHLCIADGLTQRTLYLAMYVSELSLLEAEPFLRFPASVVGAASLAVALHCLACCHCGVADAPPCASVAWPSALRRLSGYSLADLESCIRRLETAHAAAPAQPYRAIVEKYAGARYEGVSSVEAKSMFEASAVADIHSPPDCKEGSAQIGTLPPRAS